MSLSYAYQRYVNEKPVTVFRSPDGREWREATSADLITGDTEIVLGHGEPCRASEFDHLVLPGGYPFLKGMSALVPVYVRMENIEARRWAGF